MVGTSPLLQLDDTQRSYQSVRSHTESLAAPLSAEDQLVQSMPDVSPTKWHLAHTSWFFETFLLRRFLPEYRVFHPQFEQLFNSYYNSVGAQFKRACRGMLSRPSLSEILEYRAHVDAAMATLLSRESTEPHQLLELGLHHEQQHQELILTDIKHVLAQNPLHPAYRPEPVLSPVATRTASPLSYVSFQGGIVSIGTSDENFHFDNEGPAHRCWLEDFALASRPVTNGEVLEFIEAGGYRDPLLWLSDGWNWVQSHGVDCPLYWETCSNGGFDQFSLHGLHPLNPAETASHLTYFEADAIARFMGARLPTEQEWEIAAKQQSPADLQFDPRCIRPGVAPASEPDQLSQLVGGVWEWTQSAYSPYPGFTAPEGAVGEYNGKFMHNQMVLRGGSCATSNHHMRLTYRNFFPSHAQWQFSGFRLARRSNP